MKYWYSQNIIAWLLWPVSIVFCLLSFIRRFFYFSGFFKSVAFSTPVVIIGNISVGGSGKTPLLISICDYLKQQGKKPGIVSRGYGGSVTGIKQIDENDDAIHVGDEPWMIFQRSHCPVVVGADRVAAVSALLNNNDCDIVLSDDGLQHYRLQRNLEIVVVDTKRLHGNGFCLPAGPLREPVSRLKNVDMVVYNDEAKAIANNQKKNSTGIEQNCFYQLQYKHIVNLISGEKKSIQALKNQPIIAVAGIGHPERFFDLLTGEGLTIQPQCFPDHYLFTAGDITAWSGKYILMTEKDAVKCQHWLRQKQAGRDNDFNNLWYLPVTAIFNNKLKQALDNALL